MSLLTITRGDSFTFTETIQPTGTGGFALGASGISGWLFWLTAKFDYSDSDAAAAFQKLPAAWQIQTNGNQTTPGVAFCSIGPTDTASLPPYQVALAYDVQAKDTSGHIFTVDSGTLTVTPDVTIATS